MIPQNLASLHPLIALGAAAVAAMLFAPIARPNWSRTIAAVGMAAAAWQAFGRLGLPEAPATALLADDALARFGAGFAALSGLGALTFLRPGTQGREAPALLAIATLGAAVAAGAQHAATLFLGLELVSLPLIALFAFPLTRPALEAGYKYFVMGGAAAGALLLGMAMVYAATGTLALAGWRSDSDTFVFGMALVLAALAFKFSLAPFHMWTPDAFEGGPAGAAAVAGVASKGAVAIAFLRIAAEAAPPEPLWSAGLAATAGISILLGNLLALRQPTLVRMLGWSSIAQTGYMAAILASGVPFAGEALLFFVTVYAPALIVALCLAAWLGPETGVEGLRGLAKRAPVASLLLTLSLLSMAGLPPAGGFVAKLWLFHALAEAAMWPLLAIVVIGSALGFYVYFRFVTAPWASESAADPQPALRLQDRLVNLAAGAVVLAFGLYPLPLMDFAERLAP